MKHFLTRILARAAAFVVATSVLAQSNEPPAMPLWPNGAPGALGARTNDIPTVRPYLPPAATATRAAMLICPGGGYAQISASEGRPYALWLNEQGIAGFVLEYRLGTSGYKHPIMLEDVTRAMRTVRANAAQWNVDPHRIGVIGSSAGGHLASTLLTHYDAGNPDASDPIERASSRPDLGVLCYAVITMGQGTHGGSRNNLLGPNPSPELIAELSNELHVTKDTPPCFLFHTADDPVVPVQNSLNFAVALRKAGVPVELHVYEHGPHGLSLGPGARNYPPREWHPWTDACRAWLKQHGFGR